MPNEYHGLAHGAPTRESMRRAGTAGLHARAAGFRQRIMQRVRTDRRAGPRTGAVGPDNEPVQRRAVAAAEHNSLDCAKQAKSISTQIIST